MQFGLHCRSLIPLEQQVLLQKDPTVHACAFPEREPAVGKASILQFQGQGPRLTWVSNLFTTLPHIVHIQR
jgi:hypothetical protein